MIEAITEERIRVRYGETDQMGHAYYANYLFWFEQARGAWCRDRGFTYKSLEEMGYMLPVVEAHLRYKGEVKYDDDIIVRIWLSEVKRAAMRFEYQVINEKTQVVTTEGYTWHVLMGRQRKAVSIPPDVREMLERNPAEFETIR
jgi:acyl-CoA thioester hydrolase